MGSPPGHLLKSNTAPPPVAAAPVPDTASILQVLAKIANNGGNNSAPAPAPAAPASAVPSQPSSGLPVNLAPPQIPGMPQFDVSQVANLIQKSQGNSAATPASVAGQPWNIPQSNSQDFGNNNGNYSRDNFRDGNRERERSRSPDGRYNNRGRMRSRSPIRSRSPNNDSSREDKPQRTRNISHDPQLPPGTVKVFSRTLFIGGVPPFMTEPQLVDIFRPFAQVQSMVFQKEKRHAFVKVYSRAEAETARAKFEEGNRNGSLTLRARWGVGFGPRDCCDYQTGISVIPLTKLTDADKRWIVEAEYGGTGGLPLDTGLCVEEPDIEIGAGVSSKAISRRMPTNSSRNGPRSTRPDREERDDHRDRDRRWGGDRNDRNERFGNRDRGFDQREHFNNRNRGGRNNGGQNNYGGSNHGGRHNDYNGNNGPNGGGPQGQYNGGPNNYNGPPGNNNNGYNQMNDFYQNMQRQQNPGDMSQFQGGAPPTGPQAGGMPANLANLLSNLSAAQQGGMPQGGDQSNNQPMNNMFAQDPNMAANLMAMLGGGNFQGMPNPMQGQQGQGQGQGQGQYGMNPAMNDFFQRNGQNQPPR